jgi:hypothetical protein
MAAESTVYIMTDHWCLSSICEDRQLAEASARGRPGTEAQARVMNVTLR